MKRIILAMLCAAALAPAVADDYVARIGADSVRLTQRPCPDNVRAKHQSIPERAGTAHAVVGGRAFVACWVTLDQGVGLFYEDGDTGLIPIGAFARESGV